MDLTTTVKGSIGNVLLSSFERRPISFTEKNERHLPRIRQAILRASGSQLCTLHPPINRNTFLLECLNLTDLEPVEHLIAGYGLRHGTTTRIEAVHHVTGSSHSVTPTEAITGEIQRRVMQSPKAEAIIYHNHPQNLVSLLVDNLPIASSADRDWAEKLRWAWPQLARAIFGGGELRLYVGEDGYVKELKLPSFNRVMALLTRVLSV